MRECRFLIFIILGIPLLAPSGWVWGESVTPSQDEILGRYESGDRVFTRLQIGQIVSYFHQRKIDEAIVEKDFIRYQFNLETQKLIEQKTQWREDLPDRAVAVITEEQAETMAEGVAQFSKLYFISPESDVFPIKPTPENPCWVVRSIDDRRMIVTIIDAMTGEKLGYGIPPPFAGFSLTGPDYGECDPYWPEWAENAEDWFEEMGYVTEMIGCPTDAEVQAHIESDNTAMFYELAHGGYTHFHNKCPDNYILWSEVETWIADYATMPFTFLGSCDGMCDQTDNTLSFEFRKGSNHDAVVVGYCGMSEPECDACWGFSIAWQDVLFENMAAGLTVQEAFDVACLWYPFCAISNCTDLVGDTDLRLVPCVTRSLCGTVYNGYRGPLNVNSRDYYVRCNIVVPSGETLTILPTVVVAFMDNLKIVANGTLHADGGAGRIWLVSDQDRSKGMKFTGQIRFSDGGQIRVY